ncbi:phosphinothricin acetyltransferase [Rufibacter sp. DG15C]|uniref:GNAT family N-acetyltransferase n=1 Tax=Rufibacter sp. DG15C TaxID=1379909 RepID=UPI00078B67DB|nr:GNAT family N-acetyltransferase [Rufibacter sp. DG15C]AMM51517.1 phosphinothricin acetyltransferase [Rufibacter sp. DG15C]
MVIEDMLPQHWAEVKQIYLDGIATGQATFNTDAPSWEEWDKAHLTTCRFVALDGDKVCGWAALTPVSSRCVYGGVAEESVYIAQDCRGMGLGLQLLSHLITESEKAGFWTLQAGIFPENEASVKLHEKVGFRIVGTRQRLAKHYGVWRDVYLLERRSSTVGLD